MVGLAVEFATSMKFCLVVGEKSFVGWLVTNLVKRVEEKFGMGKFFVYFILFVVKMVGG